MLSRCLPHQRGFNLIELMVSLAVGLMVMGGALSVVISIIATNTATLKITRLNDELRDVMMMITRDLRRAGYWGRALNQVGSNNPASNPFALITLSADGSCVLFSYDSNNDGELNPLPNKLPNERYGYRLDTSDNAIEVRQAGAGCTDSGWQNLTDEKSINITAFNIQPQLVNTGQVTVRQYQITLTGQLNSDPTVQRTVQSTVKVRNNQIN
ncbi:hypothetical conserved protein [Candidatus Nitrosoglobus terrae]|uniref:Hypothetical conserved protein n=1 Tax=Candidatus Nitrosoglobus terrae TaxID=1630141 RepID=A0A1Q2SM42_9GAMM|nr:prepilin-type N-terminal cleavage/methylation domain-containing protein [Candidatus Nitrosoglobus terrae]BAW80192.1 hypothetical conserved protein [Candidatus Nitrosoglobus terrae]